MATYKNKTAKVLNRIKIWGLSLGVILVFFGTLMVNNWGTSVRKSRQDWYIVYSNEINAIGISGIIIVGIGIISCVVWLFTYCIIKASMPCPMCGGLLTQRSAVCPHCKVKLDWGDNANIPVNKELSSKSTYCPSCGTKAESGAFFCKNCGKNIMNWRNRDVSGTKY